ncbi:MAG: cofactor-independent phosphoglycerate mutase [Phycisphaerales bacterium]|nr:cofactor-independent phosphoglycerate mutase [Phycisphaerales bacterium]
MKYGIVIADGAADFPIAELGGRTPLQAAKTPSMDAVAQMGRLGTARTTPEGWLTGSDVCTMSLLGYDPTVYHTGRAPLEAAALGVPMGSLDWIFRVNLVTVGEDGTADEGLMLDHSAGAVTDAEARTLIADLAAVWLAKEPELMASLVVYPGVSYRNILVDSSGRTHKGVKTVPPHEIPRQPWDVALPQGSGTAKAAADVLCRLMELAAAFLPGHAVNAARRAAGKRPANMVWIWGQGTRPAMPSFASRFGCRGAMTTAVDLLSGIAALIGWEKLPVPGATSYHDNDYAGQGRAACAALDSFDVVCCHVEAPDETAHQGDWKTKVAAIEAIDTHVVAPMLQRLMSFGSGEQGSGEGWRMLILPDHYTLCATRKHDATPVPFAMAGSYVRAHRTGPFDEAHANGADLQIPNGHELMEFFISGGRVAPRGSSRGTR